MLEVKNLYKRYGASEVLKGLSFTMDKGETKVVIGPSGTGKSTLLRCINQLHPPDKGKVFLEGVEISDTKIDINKIRQKIGFVFQDFNLFTHMTALRNVSIGLEKVLKMEKEDAEKQAMNELKRVGLGKFSKRYPAQLSGGQQQRVGIARALAMNPIIILFDEPTSALDPELIGEVLQVMLDIAKEGTTMIVVTHEMGFARAVAQEMIFIDEGVIIERGTPQHFFKSPETERAKRFLHQLEVLYGTDGES